MKILCAARTVLPDLLLATCTLARKVSRWCRECDRRVHRLLIYTKYTQHWQQYSYMGDDFDDIRIALVTDADFAGGISDSRSTCVVVLSAVGPHKYRPFEVLAKSRVALAHPFAKAKLRQ